ncbi:MAG: D-amino-acid transaminase [Alphaproteobacteria bacterium]|nr:D-amino-acid transaminase [Alphaproteobacteria bacterium]
MARLAYVNGRYLPHRHAAVHIEDRGYQFGDGVYEVVTVAAGRMVDEGPHLDRLERSLSEIAMAMPMSRRSLQLVGRELVRRNGVRNGLLYIQVTRGVAPRDHKFPKQARPALVMTTKHIDFAAQPKFTDGVKVITIRDQRWARCDIKTIGLLPNCLGKQQAADSGAYEAWQVNDDGFVTEGTSSNAWIVTTDGRLVTRHLGSEILHGVTRRTILAIAAEEGIALDERPFGVDEARAAAEAFVTSATSFVTPVVRIDDTVIGDGTPGPLSRRLLAWYRDYVAGLRDTG